MSHLEDRASGVDGMIQEVLDGTASESTRVRVQQMCAQDPDVAARFDALKAIFADLDDLEVLPLPSTAARGRSVGRRSPRRWARIALPLAASAAAVVVGVALFWPDARDDLGPRAPATLIAGRTAVAPVVWEARDLRMEIVPAAAADELRIVLRDEAGDRRVRLSVDPSAWTIVDARSALGADAVSSANAIVWTTRAGETIETIVRLQPEDGPNDPLEIRLEVDGMRTVRTIPTNDFQRSTNSGDAGRY